jgi:DNA modification methylase
MAVVLRADARQLPLADESVDLIVTSPPFWSLRSYQDGGQHYDGQLGSEPSPTEFLDELIDATREMMRVLKPSGSIWVNLGDKYAGIGGGGVGSSDGVIGRGSRPARRDVGIREKSLIGIPWRYALRCIDDLGLILRAEVIWQKPNGLPESVTDRVRRSHETWFHLVKQPRYYSAVDEIRETPVWGREVNPAWRQVRAELAEGSGNRHGTGTGLTRAANPLGKLPGSVWEIPTQPLTVPAHLGVDHFAAFPMEWPRRIIRGWSPPGICVECGDGRRPVADKRYVKGQSGTSGFAKDRREPFGRQNGTGMAGKPAMDALVSITGYACACPEPTAPTRPAAVLDPFGGTGTVALVASILGRIGVSIDLSADYCRLAAWRTTDPGERARALEVPKPPPVPDNQMDLFGEATA